ncbi:MAG: ABC transporter permease, partial [Acidimicrobiales bacterium]
MAVGSMVVIVLIILMAVLAPVVAHVLGHGPFQQFRTTGLSPQGIPVGPSRRFLLGTDELGRDVLVRVFYGARISLLAGVVASGLAVSVGIVVGMLAGFLGGIVDTLLARLLDVVLSLP